MHCQELFLLIHMGLGPEPTNRSVHGVGEALSNGEVGQQPFVVIYLWNWL